LITALIIFVIMYVLLLALPKYRSWIAIGTAALYVILGIMPLNLILSSIDFNVLLMIGGTMGLVSLFSDSGMPSLMADIILDKMPNVKWTIIALSLFSGFVSAFIDNVATVLMIAPVAIAIARKFDISPVPIVISISVSSNLQGAATLVGDTTSILLGGYAHMDFLDFFWFQGRIGLFFVVEFSALMTMFVLLYLFRNETQPTMSRSRTEVKDRLPTILLLGTIVLLIGASFIKNKPSYTNGLICICLYAIGFFANFIKKRKKVSTRKELFKSVADIDFSTLLLLAGLFIVIASITQAGVIDAIARIIAKLGGSNIFLTYTIVVFASVLLSAFIDNIPYVATMLPVVQNLAIIQGIEPYLLYFGLLIGATLGGNLTPVGASANITAIGILRREGYQVRNKDFMQIGLPFSTVAVLTGYILIWFIWK
jgi:Na+/H+ antiporter NhaD/arsenite permease-like protein